MKKAKWKWGGVLLLVVAAVCLATVSYVKDTLVRQQFEDSASRASTVPVTVDNASLGLLGGSIELEGLRVGSPEGFDAPHVVRIEQTTISLDLWSLTKPEVIIHRIDCEGLEVLLELGAGGTNLGVLLEKIRQKPEDKSGKKLRIGKIVMTRGSVKLADTSGTLTDLPRIEIEPGEDREALSPHETVLVTTVMVLKTVVSVAEDVLPEEYATKLLSRAEEILSGGLSILEELGNITEGAIELGAEATGDLLEQVIPGAD